MRIKITIVLFITSAFLFAQSQKVTIVNNADNFKLQVDGSDFFINGMNWDYVPIGTTITDPGIWNQSDDIIKKALDSEMALLKNMGVNAIRTYNLKPKWIQYIYENYRIYTMLNITFGAYGLNINGAWIPNTNYADSETIKVLMQEAKTMANTYKNTPGLLLYMIGNENNYHLSWTGAETEDIPIDETDKNKLAAKYLYKAFNQAAKEVKQIDNRHPVAICNGDLLYLDIVKEECPDVDIYGTNMYRGKSFGDAFYRVREELKKPVLFAEFGSDAFNAVKNAEDQEMQAFFMVENWKEIYENAAGLGKAGNSIGGFTFQFSDGWWKYKQTENLDRHDNTASWANGGYYLDFEEGENNMNEEWFGICAKGPTDDEGLYQLYPRAAYYALKEVHKINPYSTDQSALIIEKDVDNIQIVDAMLRARGDKAALEGSKSKILSISKLRAEITTFSTGGELITTPSEPDPNANTFPDQLGFDHMESYFVGIEANPSPEIRANVEFNILGNVATNPINEIFYENRGRPIQVETANGLETINDNNRIQVYRAEAQWNHKMFDLDFFYRTGHYHWGYDGDFFGLYPEANYGPNIDIYNGDAPFGFEIDGKKSLKGLTVAFGPELWWGANPAALLKYTRNVGKFEVTGIFHEDIDNAPAAVSSFAVPLPKTRRATVQVKREFGKFGVQLGGIWAGQPLNGRAFQFVENGVVYEDLIGSEDNWGGKVKITYTGGKFNWYGQAAYQGLVANGGADFTRTFTGWRLKDSGSGNQYNFLTGFTYSVGNLQIAPNFLWQKPLVGPISSDINAPGRPRNIIDDPFAVRANRETVAGELLLTWDPTPATWFYAWDNDRIEDAKFAASLGFVYRHLPTTQDAAIGILADGRTTFAFDGAPPAKDLWEANARIVSKLTSDFGMIANLYGGPAQANGDSDRTIDRYGADLRFIYKKWKLIYSAKANDWGPFDYHRDFNQTYPVQLMADLSISVGKQDWFILPSTRIGVRATYRTLDQFSPRYAPAAVPENTFPPEPILSPVGFDDGNEWEIRTYLHINIGK